MRLYQALASEKNILLNEQNRHHVMNVMRYKQGDTCYVFDGEGHEVKAKIIRLTKKEVELEILETIENNKESVLKIHLFQALCKGEKMDWLIQKSVELGVTEITPMMTERCEVKLSHERLEKKVAHWQSIMISAAEQSGRAVLPVLHPRISLPEALTNSDDALSLLFSPSSLSSWPVRPIHPKKINIFIGPEGGFSEAEILFAEKKKIPCVTLGKRILRTETASLAIIASLQTVWGDFQ